VNIQMKKYSLLVVLSIAAAAAAGCVDFDRQSSATSPTAAGNNSLMGSWTSGSLIPTPSTCTDFNWTVSEQTATTAKGSFSATCAGDLELTGTAQGSFTTPTSIAWNAQGNATAPGLTSCAITLTGTATAGIDTITVPYRGDTCLGPVSGIETLRKR
jgi:hypothetical protein